MSVKRGQVTIFMIVGIMILLISGLFIMFFSPDEKLKVELFESEFKSENKPKVVFFVEGCVEDKLEEAIEIAGLQGGQIFYDEELFLITDEKYFGYFYKGKKQLVDKNTVEKEIAKYGDVFLDECIQNFTIFSKENLYVIEKGVQTFNLNSDLVSNNFTTTIEDVANSKHSSKAIIQEDYVRLDLYYPLEIFRSEDKFGLDTFSVKIPSELAEFLDIAEQITDQSNGLINLEYLSSFEPFIKGFPYDGELSVYSIYDDDNSLPRSFIFAVDKKSNSAPKFRPFPRNLFLIKGTNFVMPVRAYDPDNHKITFSTDNEMFPINNNGLFNFTPTSAANEELTITAEDSQGLKTELVINVEVGNEE